ncbi:MAG: M14 family zinc carboxypeptidase, partial [Pseudomonadota bacterium]
MPKFDSLKTPVSAQRPLLAIGLLLLAITVQAQHHDLPGLPASMQVNDDMPKPAELFGFSPTDRHLMHHELLAFYQALAARSDRVAIETIGQSYGGREQVLLYFSEPSRLANLDQLRRNRVEQSRSGEGPAVVWLGHGVHGNEASAVTSAALMAWYLAAAEDEQVQRWLRDLVIVMEPMLNPDGIDRFAHWVNNHRGRHPSPDPVDREHNEVWPNGRTSYYWFDLNRDWLPLTHPESRNRLRHFHQWRPNVVTDVHEMGHNNTYFFQPGIPERNNPITPARVFELTQKIAEFHADILDQAGQPYYTKESFDDYYAGKGSTYPDLTGSVGILFEQASARGHVMQTDFGLRTFAEATANQVLTSISTLQGAWTHRAELQDYQAEFFASAGDQRGGWIIADGNDPARAQILIQKLLGHAIEVRPTTESVTLDGVDYAAGRAWVIPARQDQYRLVQSIFAVPTELPMETFYDVSAWPMHLAYNLPMSRVNTLPDTDPALDSADSVAPPLSQNWPSTAPAWVIPWDQYRAAAVAAELIERGYRIQASTSPFSIATAQGPRALIRGSLIINPGIQSPGLPDVASAVQQLATEYSVELLAAQSGLSLAGHDLGSPSAPVLGELRPALLIGSGLRANHAGYLWHWFDTRLDHPITQLDWRRLDSPNLDLSQYSHLLLPDGNYFVASDAFKQNLVEYVRGGGQLIALRNAAAWVETLDLGWSFIDASESGESDESNESLADDTDDERKRYADYDLDRARTFIGGSALNMQLDITHPLGFGYQQNEISVFRRGAYRLKTTTDRYAQAGRYTDAVLSAGYLSDATRAELANTTAMDATRLGRGIVIRMADD